MDRGHGFTSYAADTRDSISSWHAMALPKDKPIRFDDSLKRVEFTVENRAGFDHDASFQVSGLPAGKYQVIANGKPAREFTARAKEEIIVPVSISGNEAAVSIERIGKSR